MLFDEDLRFLVSDGVLLGALGLSRETTEGRTLAEISTPENVMVLERLCRAALAGEHGDADLDRAGLNVHVTVVPVRNAAGAAATGLMVLTDVTAQKAVEARLAAQAEQLTALSIRDELTGLLNRRGFLARAEEEAARAARTSSTFAIVFADLNGLKTINDTCGHEEGDAAIRAMGAVLTRSFRDTDVVARLGGDEFVVLVRDVEKEVVASLVERTRNEIANENAGGARLFRLSASIGSAESCRDTQTSVEDLLDAADRAMYEQKLRRRISTTPVIRVRAA
jgi:diguanylate cyclase (GGDEF)-like protein